MRSTANNIVIFLLTLSIGLGAFHIFDAAEPAGNSLDPTEIENSTRRDFDFDASHERHTYTCGDETGETNFKPVLEAWLSGVHFDDDHYCSETLLPSKGFSGANIALSEIDVNGDSQMELAIKTQCSLTGNCELSIFQRSGKQAKEIFRDRYMTQLFGLSTKKRNGYFDLWTRDHGSWNYGSQVKYRFNGSIYVPFSCSDYEYKVTEFDDQKVAYTDQVATITPRNCRSMLGDLR